MDEYWEQRELRQIGIDMKTGITAILQASGDFSRIDPDYVFPIMGDELDRYANMQKSRHIYGLRRPGQEYDGLEMLVLVNHQSFPSDEDFRYKFDALSQRGVYVFPVFWRGAQSPFLTRFGSSRRSIRYLLKEIKEKLIRTTKNERTVAELNDGVVYYFNPKTRELWAVAYSERPITVDYRHRHDLFKQSADLVTVRLHEVEEKMKRFTLEPYESSSGVLIARPTSLSIEERVGQLPLF